MRQNKRVERLEQKYLREPRHPSNLDRPGDLRNLPEPKGGCRLVTMEQLKFMGAVRKACEWLDAPDAEVVRRADELLLKWAKPTNQRSLELLNLIKKSRERRLWLMNHGQP